jgi:hypothetical protein
MMHRYPQYRYIHTKNLVHIDLQRSTRSTSWNNCCHVCMSSYIYDVIFVVAMTDSPPPKTTHLRPMMWYGFTGIIFLPPLRASEGE